MVLEIVVLLLFCSCGELNGLVVMKYEFFYFIKLFLYTLMLPLMIDDGILFLPIFRINAASNYSTLSHGTLSVAPRKRSYCCRCAFTIDATKTGVGLKRAFSGGGSAQYLRIG